MTSQSSGGSGSGLPGVTGDGQTPGGLDIAGQETVTGALTSASLATGSAVVAGALTAGDPNAASVPSFITLNGNVTVNDSPANQVDEDPNLIIRQSAALSQDNKSEALFVRRSGDIGGFDYTRPTVAIHDNSSSAAPMLVVEKSGGTQFQVDGDGVQVHGKLKTGASVTHTASVLSGKCVPIYDESGTLLGYMPLYN